jgi:rubrerythrin/rhodanese-related sulfurtransferase
MDNLEFKTMTAVEFRQYLRVQTEGDFLVIDVRQESEYEMGHIPGAKLMPLAEVETKLFTLPSERDLIFYCHNGGRSQWAASLAGEGEVSNKTVYNLMGGLLAWEGATLSGFPRVQVFARDQKPQKLLKTAMELEKGAWRFYRYAMDNYRDSPVSPVLEQISIAEKGHASLIYRFLQGIEADLPAFEPYYQHLKGEILEGGMSFEDACARLADVDKRSATGIVDLALSIEYAAFDLYRTMAERIDDPQARETFLAVAQAEKGHMRSLARSLASCAS